MNSNILFLFWQKKDWNDLEKAKIEFVYFMVTGQSRVVHAQMNQAVTELL